MTHNTLLVPDLGKERERISLLVFINLFIFLFVIAFFKYMTAGERKKKTKKIQNKIIRTGRRVRQIGKKKQEDILPADTIYALF